MSKTKIFDNLVLSAVGIAKEVIKTVTYYADLFEAKVSSWMESFFGKTPSTVTASNQDYDSATTELEHSPVSQKIVVSEKINADANEEVSAVTSFDRRDESDEEIEEGDEFSEAGDYDYSSGEEEEGDILGYNEWENEYNEGNTVSIHNPMLQRLLSSTKIEQVKAAYTQLSDQERDDVDNFANIDVREDKVKEDGYDSGYEEEGEDNIFLKTPDILTNLHVEESEKADFEWDNSYLPAGVSQNDVAGILTACMVYYVNNIKAPETTAYELALTGLCVEPAISGAQYPVWGETEC